MGKFSNEIATHHREFIEQQKIFFTGTAPLDGSGHVNVSPKGLDCFRVIDESTVAYMDLVSSGNETSAHILENGRITIMFCSFDEKPNILRLYGKGFAVLPGSKEWDTYAPLFQIYLSTRQIIVAKIQLVQTSCGFGVPMYDFKSNRDIHFEWAATKGKEGLEKYVEEKNLVSLDGLPTAVGLQRQT